MKKKTAVERWTEMFEAYKAMRQLEDDKATLLEMARRGEPRPDRNSRLGIVLEMLTTKPDEPD